MKKSNLLVMIFLILGLAACNKNSEEVSILIYNQSDPYINKLSNSIFDSFEEQGLKVKQYDANLSQNTQNDQLQEALDKGTKLVILNSVYRLASYSIIEKCNKKNVPVLFYNREPLFEDLEKSPNSYYVGANADNFGAFQANSIISLLGPATNINKAVDKNNNNVIETIILKGEQGHQDAEKRTSGSINRLRELGYSLDIKQTLVADWNENKSYELVRQNKDIFRNIELILSNNDEMAIGAINCLLDNEIYQANNIIPVVGVNGTSKALEYVDSGLMYSTVINDIDLQVYAIKSIGLALLNNKNVTELPLNFTNERFVLLDGKIYKKH